METLLVRIFEAIIIIGPCKFIDEGEDVDVGTEAREKVAAKEDGRDLLDLQGGAN